VSPVALHRDLVVPSCQDGDAGSQFAWRMGPQEEGLGHEKTYEYGDGMTPEELEKPKVSNTESDR
jgi:hypothetical protein